jgi:ADP-heptose:LPS heptosyltransferase
MPQNTSTSTRITPRALLVNALCVVARLSGALFSKREASLQIVPQNIRRVLWIRLDHIGDVVMSLPALHALRERNPHAQIDVLVRPGCAALFENNPDASRVIAYDSPRFPQKKNTRGAGLFRTLTLIRRLRHRGYDIAIDMRGDDIARLLAFFSAVPRRLGPDRIFYESISAPNFSFLMTHTVPLPEEPRHAVENNLSLLRVLDVSVEAPSYRFNVAPAQQEAVTGKLGRSGVPQTFATIHACSNDAARNWQPEKFAAVADYLVQHHDLGVVVTGAPSDTAYNTQIIELMRHAQRAYNAAGVFALQELSAFYERAKLMVTVDTGPMHIAAAMGTPIVALFLPRLAPRHHPYGQSDAVVLGSEDSLNDISVESVTAAIQDKLEA